MPLQTVVRTFSTPGNYTWICPRDVSFAKVECWGGGGKGGSRTSAGSGGGGGGGAYAANPGLPVSGGTQYILEVGAGSTTTEAGGNSTFDTNKVLSQGGSSVANNSETGAAGGLATTSTGQVKYAGGRGADGVKNSYGGGGGEGASSTASGNNAVASAGGTGADGGDGGDGGTSSNSDGLPGQIIGGGGGGARRQGGTRNGGNGANGQVRITYQTTDIEIISSVEAKTLDSSSQTFTHTMPDGFVSTGVLAAIYIWEENTRSINSVTYAGQTMTRLVSHDEGAAQNLLEFWFLPNPPAGDNQVTVTCAGTYNEISTYVAGLINVKPIGQPDAAKGETDHDTTVGSLSLSTNRDRSVIFGLGDPHTGNVSVSGTNHIRLTTTLYAENYACVSFVPALTPPGTVTLNYTNGTTDFFALAAVALLRDSNSVYMISES